MGIIIRDRPNGDVVSQKENYLPSLMSVYFESAMDFLEFQHEQSEWFDSESSIGHDALWQFRKHKESSKGEDWYGIGNRTMQDTIDKMTTGNSEMHKMVEHLASQLDENKIVAGDTAQKTLRRKRKMEFGAFGDEIDIHKVYSGDLDKAWRRTRIVEHEAEVKMVTIFVSIIGNSNLNVSNLLWTSACVVKAVSELEAQGKSVRVIAGGCAENAFMGIRKRFSSAMCVKDYNQKMSPERITACCNLGFFRSFGFLAYYMQSKYRPEIGLGQAVYQVQRSSVPINILEDVEKGHSKIIYIDGIRDIQGAKTRLDNIQNFLK